MANENGVSREEVEVFCSSCGEVLTEEDKKKGCRLNKKEICIICNNILNDVEMGEEETV